MHQIDDVEHAEGEMEADRHEDEHGGQNDHIEGVDGEESGGDASDCQSLLEDAAVVEIADISRLNDRSLLEDMGLRAQGEGGVDVLFDQDHRRLPAPPTRWRGSTARPPPAPPLRSARPRAPRWA